MVTVLNVNGDDDDLGEPRIVRMGVLAVMFRTRGLGHRSIAGKRESRSTIIATAHERTRHGHKHVLHGH